MEVEVDRFVVLFGEHGSSFDPKLTFWTLGSVIFFDLGLHFLSLNTIRRRVIWGNAPWGLVGRQATRGV